MFDIQMTGERGKTASPVTAAKTPERTMISVVIYANPWDNQHAATHNCGPECMARWMKAR
jgi:hypothetical protein